MGKFKRILTVMLSLVLGLSLLTPAALAAPGVITDEMSFNNRTLSRKVAGESMVLLQNNNNALPLKPGEKIAIFGGSGGNWHKGGSGSGDVRINDSIIYDAVEGLQEMENQGKIDVVYTKNDDGISQSDANAAKNAGAKTAIVVIDRNSWEGGDMSATDGDYYTSNNERNKLNYINNAGIQNIVVVLNTGRVMDASWFKSQSYIDSILVAWQPGVWGGLALADVLVGDVNPSGKLTDTWVNSYERYPTTDNFFRNKFGVDTQGFNATFWHTDYTEDVYVGYRYFETFDPSAVIYEFGYGLSYTTFAFSNYSVTNDNKNINVSVDVKNTGNYAGKEVVQVYFSAPQGVLGKPAKELAAYQKTDLLQPGQTQTVKLSFPISDMSSYDDTGKTGHESAYVLEAGSYIIYVGSSIRKLSAQGTYNVSSLTVTEQLTEQVEPYELDWRLVNDNGTMKLEDMVTYDEMTTAGDEFITLNANGAKRIEAEDCAYKQRYSRARHNGNTCALDIGGENEDGYNQPYNWYDFYVYAPTAGSYEVRLGFGRGNSSSMTAAIKVDDVYVSNMNTNNGTITINSTGNVWTIREHGPLTVNLSKGNHIVRVMLPDGNQDGRFDYITFNYGGRSYSTPATEYVPVADPAQNHGITFMDVYNNNALLDNFVDQMSYAELADLLSGNRNNNEGFDAQGTIGSMPQYQIPAIQVCDGPAGVDHLNNAGQTAWPVGTAVASTWNAELIEEMGYGFGSECQAVGVDLILAPGMNIHRNPICGRNFEYYSEDPLLTGMTAAALVTGLENGGASACLKHFVGNEREKSRYYTESRVSERAMREIYLKAFEVAIKNSDPDFMMTSYNRVNGEYTSESVDMITNIVRGEWGWTGSIVTDWWNGANQALEVIAGNDLKMQNADTDEVERGLATGRLPRSVALECAKRVINAIMKSDAAERMNIKSHTIYGNRTNTIPAIDYSWADGDISSENSENSTYTTIPTNTYGGNWICYYLDVEQAGTYNLMFRVAAPGDGGGIEILGDDIRLGNITNNTGSAGWHDWRDSQTIKVTLPEGRTVLRLNFPGDAINVLYFNLTRVNNGNISVTPDDGTVAPGRRLQMTSSDSNVNWSVKGNTSSATTIDSNGILTVGKDEISSSVVVYATSKTNSELVGGVHVKVQDDGVFILRGDVNDDDLLTVQDLVYLKQAILEKNATEYQMTAGDMDENGELNVLDMVMIKQLLMERA